MRMFIGFALIFIYYVLVVSALYVGTVVVAVIFESDYYAKNLPPMLVLAYTFYFFGFRAVRVAEKIRSLIDGFDEMLDRRRRKSVAREYQKDEQLYYGHDLLALYWKEQVKFAPPGLERDKKVARLVVMATQEELTSGREYLAKPIEQGKLTKRDYDDYFFFLDSFGLIDERTKALNVLADHITCAIIFSTNYNGLTMNDCVRAGIMPYDLDKPENKEMFNDSLYHLISVFIKNRLDLSDN